MRATDAEGRTVLPGPVGASDLRVWRKQLAHERSYCTRVAEQDDEPERWCRAWTGLGTFELLPGPATSTRTVRLPVDRAELPDRVTVIQAVTSRSSRPQQVRTPDAPRSPAALPPGRGLRRRAGGGGGGWSADHSRGCRAGSRPRGIARPPHRASWA
jgi:hypothetical protein